jgi:hypothetical protein
MEFPALVYRCPGTNQRPGGTYSYRQIADDDELTAALADGWFSTLPEAVIGVSAVTAQEVSDDAPPTREELEAKATELQIKFDGRTSDKALRDRIAAALEE